MGKSKKGTAWEREFSKRLSLWWTNEENDAVFWKTSISGGRATSRTNKGKATKNHYGDICATDPIGQPLMDVFTMELKRGYNKNTIADLLDKRESSSEQVYEEWFHKLIETSKKAKTLSWALVVQRDRREPLIFLPSTILTELLDHRKNAYLPINLLEIKNNKNEIPDVTGLRLSDFFQVIFPELIGKLLKDSK